MDIFLIIAISLLLVFFASVFIFIKKTNKAQNVVVAPPLGNAALRPVAGPVMAGGRRRVAARRENVRRVNNEDGSEESDDGATYDEELEALKQSGKVGTKKLKKLEEKAERKAQREVMEQERAERKERQEQLERKRKREEQLLLKEEEARAEEERQMKEIEKRREEEEYQALKLQFSVEDEGVDALPEEEMQNLLEIFINHIKENKVVVLEDLARKFKLKTQDVIDRIKYLQESDQLTGILDDRGKFIYITTEEYRMVAEFIKKRGRVSITELANNMNNLIQLNPVFT